jgi:Flp pilus assembly protein TadD
MNAVHDLLERGRLHRATGDPISATRHLAEAADLAPTDRTVLTELALAHFQSASLGKAEKVLRTLLELDPSDAYARLLLGRTLSRASRHAEALPELRMAAAMTGDPEVAAEVARVESRLS